MENEQLISAEDLCAHYQIEYSFLQTLNESGLVRITTIEEKGFVQVQELPDIERFMRLHYDLNLNAEGIEVVCRLLDQIKELQHQISLLRGRLGLYESLPPAGAGGSRGEP